MNRRLSVILFSAFVVAALCSYLVYRIARKEATPQPKPNTTHIMVAARDLQLGALVRDADLTTGDWVGPLPKGAIVSKDGVIGRGVVQQIYQGEPILDSRLAAVGSGGGMAAMIPEGMRACAVRVDDVVGVAGFVLPGMRVDVLVSGTGPGASQTQGPSVRTLLQNIQVLSAGANLQKDNDGKPVQVPVVNLLVTPEQAELLSLASNQTKIQLVLRNPLDTNTPETQSISVGRLFSDKAPEAPKKVAFRKPAPQVDKPVPPRVYLVEVYNGEKRSEQKFEGENTDGNQ